MEKAFKKGFLLSKSGSSKPTAKCNKKPIDCSDPKSEAKTLNKAFKREFLLNNPVPEDQKIIIAQTNKQINQTELEEIDDQNIPDDLPGDVLELIFSFLDPNTIKSVASVSKWWKNVVEKRSLWKWAKAKMTQPSLWEAGCTNEELYANSLQQLEIVESNRLTFLEEIHLLDTRKIRGHMNEIVTNLVQIDNLKNVVLSVGKNSEIDPQSIAKLVSSVEKFKLSCCDDDDSDASWTPRRRNPGYNEEIIPAIMRELVSNERSQTKSLNINIQGGFILLNVDPDLFARGTMKLENLSTYDAGMTQLQGQKILECLATAETDSLKELNLKLILSQIPPETLSEAAGKLRKLVLGSPAGLTGMTVNQAVSLFQKMKSKESALERLTLSSQDFEVLSIRYGSG